jgi:predicted nuclease of restriction endonuclease-like (RecB) superfamily
MNSKQEQNYINLLVSIKQEIVQKQYDVGKYINTSLLELYRNIGQKLVEIQDTEWKAIVNRLARDLLNEFPWVQWFSADNLWRMKKFYQTYSCLNALAPLVQQISRSNHIVIMEKCKNNFEKEFYLRLCLKQACSKRVLINKIESKEYERYITEHKHNNFALIEEANIEEKTYNILKEQYLFDFLTLWKKFSEKELEQNLLEKLKKFLMELWLWFAYMGNQFEIKVDDQSYFLDLLFYHTKLKRYIVIELKIWEFKPEYAGKLNFYVHAVNRTLKSKEDKSTLWLLLCKEKKSTTVEIAFEWMKTPLAVSEYRFDTKDLSQNFKNNLPEPEKLKKILEDV